MIRFFIVSIFLLICLTSACKKVNSTIPIGVLRADRSGPTNYVEGGESISQKNSDKVTRFARDYLVSLLKQCGHTKIINDSSGVGVKNNQLRFWAFENQTQTVDDGFKMTIEFRVSLGDGVEIQEFVSGQGYTEDEAIAFCLTSFGTSTFPVIARALIPGTTNETQKTEIEFDGSRFFLFTQDPTLISPYPVESLSLEQDLARVISRMELSSEIHWFKWIYAHSSSGAREFFAVHNNRSSQDLREQATLFSWPESKFEFVAKQFAILVPAAEQGS